VKGSNVSDDATADFREGREVLALVMRQLTAEKAGEILALV
jgi:hypothetical protein